MFCALLVKISGKRLQDYWSSGIYIFYFHVPKSFIQNLVKTAKWFLRKACFNFHM